MRRAWPWASGPAWTSSAATGRSTARGSRPGATSSARRASGSGRRPASGPASGRTSDRTAAGGAHRAPPGRWHLGDDDVKKLINAVDDVVSEALRGMLAAHGDLIEI